MSGGVCSHPRILERSSPLHAQSLRCTCACLVPFCNTQVREGASAPLPFSTPESECCGHHSKFMKKGCMEILMIQMICPQICPGHALMAPCFCKCTAVALNCNSTGHASAGARYPQCLVGGKSWRNLCKFKTAACLPAGLAVLQPTTLLPWTSLTCRPPQCPRHPCGLCLWCSTSIHSRT